MYIGIRGSTWPLESICSGPMESPSSNIIPPHSPLSVAVAIGIGGAVGASARWAAQWLWPWSADLDAKHFSILEPVLVINVGGAFFLGVLLSRIERVTPHPLLRPFLAVGVLGTSTTWSSLVAEITLLDAAGRTEAAFSKLGLSLVLGLLAFVAGQRLSQDRGASS